MSPLQLRYGVLTSILLLLLVLSVTGCGTSAPKDGPKPGSKVDSGASAELAKLPPQDRALAEKQKTCPVTDAPLGSMGVPYKVTLKSQTVFLCCAGCEEELNAQADKYLAKLKGTGPK